MERRVVEKDADRLMVHGWDNFDTGRLIGFLATLVFAVLVGWVVKAFYGFLDQDNLEEMIGTPHHFIQLVLLPWPLILYRSLTSVPLMFASLWKRGLDELSPKDSIDGMRHSIKWWRRAGLIASIVTSVVVFFIVSHPGNWPKFYTAIPLIHMIVMLLAVVLATANGLYRELWYYRREMAADTVICAIMYSWKKKKESR